MLDQRLGFAEGFGHYDDRVGHGGGLDDVRTSERSSSRTIDAVERWLRQEHSPAHLILGGYSFGAAVAWQALTSLAPPDQMILIAPPVSFMPSTRRPVGFRLDVFAGDADQFVDAAALNVLGDAGIHIIPGADHFFGGKWGDLAAGIEQVLQPAG